VDRQVLFTGSCQQVVLLRVFPIRARGAAWRGFSEFPKALPIITGNKQPFPRLTREVSQQVDGGARGIKPVSVSG